jgi:capsular exopolysaccharide synthesis family protein
LDGISSQDALMGSADPSYYWRLIRRRKWLILTAFGLVVGGAAAWTMKQPKVYGAETSLIIDVTAPRFLDKDVQDVSTDSYSNYWANREYYETQTKVITSRSVSERVVEKLGLMNDANFLGVDKIADDAVRAAAMQKIDAVSRLQSKIKVDPVKDSRVTLIKLEDSDANRAALLANEVAEAYIAENLALKLQVTDTASKWLEERRTTLEKESKQSEIALYDFKRTEDVLTTSLESQQSMVSQRLTATNAALTEVALKIAGLKARVDMIRGLQAKAAAGDIRWAEGLPAAGLNEFVAGNKRRLADQQLKCAELKERYLEGHPKLAECLEMQRVIEKDLLHELNTIIVAAEADLKENTDREKNLTGLYTAAKSEAFDVNRKQIQFESLKREADNNQRLYDAVFKRLKDIELSGMLRTSNVRVLDAARPVLSPIRPILEKNLLIALLVGLLFGLALALMLEKLDSSVTSQLDIEERLGVPFLGVIPRIPGPADGEVATPEFLAAKDLHVHSQPKSTVAEACRAVRTNLLFMSPDKPFHTMVVTSSGPQEGKSTTVISLGIAVAQSGSRVVLLDTDMRRPRLHKPFGVPNDIGVSSLVVGEGTLEDAVKTTDVPNLFVLPCGPIPPNPAELLHTQAFKALLAKLAEKFDRVILDSPPIGAVADAAVLATQVDAALVVIKAGKTQREVAKRGIRALNDVKARVCGAVLNDIDSSKSRYADYYGYGYSAYGYYYADKKEGASS